MADEIIYMVEDGVGVLRVNRPGARNALNWAAQEQFAGVVDAAAQDETLRALIITGTGRAFVSGGDLKELAHHPEAAAGARLNRVMGQALARLPDLPVPVIAAVNGDAAGGGCEILTACDLRLAVEDAQLRFVQVKVGLTTGWGGAARLVRLVGLSRAVGLLLPGRVISATEAHEMGLVHGLVPAGDDVLASARALATDLAALPADALAAMKALLYASAQGSPADAYAYEADLFTQLWNNPNHREALAAFLEKRPPQFNQ